MAARIEIEKLKECEFRVRAIEDGRESTHRVTLSQDDYRRLSGGKIEPHELIRRSFEFTTPARSTFFTARVLALERRALGDPTSLRFEFVNR